MSQEMTPSRPYLLKAFFDWLLDNEMTPHLLVNARVPHVKVPMQYVQDGQIVLNISPSAVMAFTMDMDAVSFNARFGGVPFQVYIPMAAVLAIHARENGVGTFFPPEPAYEEWLKEEDTIQATASDSPDDEPEPPRPSGRPSLRVVK
ncbi:ClpXP protease specificity-enhancing factor [Pseudaeromonas paramecii]|uniref:ClpXP protease specificity-enhancing factor n=2 Tax=Pseudaeromonas paramecii TaxID=2138166 RepID=A0ABP8Q6K2_9GAMM